MHAPPRAARDQGADGARRRGFGARDGLRRGLVLPHACPLCTCLCGVSRPSSVTRQGRAHAQGLRSRGATYTRCEEVRATAVKICCGAETVLRAERHRPSQHLRLESCKSREEKRSCRAAAGLCAPRGAEPRATDLGAARAARRRTRSYSPSASPRGPPTRGAPACGSLRLAACSVTAAGRERSRPRRV